ncbi:MAG TPA: molybdopterin dinucleotide binding domain-containing protein, partial [Actinomycetaceae bacterium]|nr:molybdopterin dinucleotide binding domain-containing protein [Actinomycetaceae bacterium]
TAAGGVGVLPGGRLPLEDAFAWSRFARSALHTNDIDFRMRHSSAEEASFLARRVAGAGLGVTYTDLEHAPHVLLVALEPEEECGTAFLRLRKGMLAGRVAVTTLAPMTTRGSTKLRATVVATIPGREAAALERVPTDHAELAEALAQPGAIILVGERAGAQPGTLSAAEALAERTGARLAWIPRRAGERAAVEAGLLPGLLPGARRVADAQSRADLAAQWAVDQFPSTEGRDLAGILTAVRDGELGGLLVGGVDPLDAPDPQLVRDALAAAGFVVQLEVRRSEITDHADIVLPVAPPVEKGGTFINWEGRHRPFGQVLASRALADRTVLDALAREMGTALGTATLDEVHEQLAELADWRPETEAPMAQAVAAEAPQPGAGQAVLATWKMMIDDGRCLDGEPHLAGTAHRPVVRMSPQSASAIGAADGSQVSVRGPRGAITLPLALTSMPDGVVWLPQHSPGSHVNDMLGAGAGALVDLEVAR